MIARAAHRHDRPGRPDDGRDRRATTGPPGHVSTGQLPTPDEARRLIEAAYERYRGVSDGTVASYIPALASVSPDLFGVSVVAANGNVHSVGDALYPFTIQSISKAFVFALVLEAIGADEARRRLGVNSTGLPFNSVMAIELQPAAHDEPDGELGCDRHHQPRPRRHGRGEVGARASGTVGVRRARAGDRRRRCTSPSWPPTAATTASPTSCTATSGCGSIPTRRPTSTRASARCS